MKKINKIEADHWAFAKEFSVRDCGILLMEHWTAVVQTNVGDICVKGISVENEQELSVWAKGGLNI